MFTTSNEKFEDGVSNDDGGRHGDDEIWKKMEAEALTVANAAVNVDPRHVYVLGSADQRAYHSEAESSTLSLQAV